MRRFTLLTAALAALAAPAPGLSQSVQQTFEQIDQLQETAPALQRAMNLARNTAVTLNGGLTKWSPASCMFSSGASGGSCLVQSDSQGFLFRCFLFRFNGGTPGWQQLGNPPTTTTEILISPDGRTVSELVYNGPVL